MSDSDDQMEPQSQQIAKANAETQQIKDATMETYLYNIGDTESKPQASSKNKSNGQVKKTVTESQPKLKFSQEELEAISAKGYGHAVLSGFRNLYNGQTQQGENPSVDGQ